MIVYVHFHKLHTPARGTNRRFQRRRQLLARAAPRRPEIDQHRLLAELLNDVLSETGRCCILDRVPTAGRETASGAEPN